MNEADAKKCWCPMVRIAPLARPIEEMTLVDNRGNPGAEFAPDTRCLGSECMAFRWVPDVVINLGKDRSTFIDQEDAALAARSWWWDGRYAKGTDDEYLHRMVVTRALGAIPAGLFVDHIDGDALNNRRGNLRVVTKAQNAANAAARGGVSQYRGVHKSRGGRWRAQIARGNIRLTLGTFDTEREAASAYDAAAKDIHGAFARLNLKPVVDSGRHCYCGLAGAPINDFRGEVK